VLEAENLLRVRGKIDNNREVMKVVVNVWLFYLAPVSRSRGSWPYTVKGSVQGTYMTKLITIQGYPELHEEVMRELLIARHARGIFDNNVFEGHDDEGR